jgi:hypothetical protein
MIMKRTPIAAVPGILWVACSPDAAAGPTDPFGIETDSVVYHLEHEPVMYSVGMRVHVTNPLDRTIYLHRACGYGDEQPPTASRSGRR